MGVIQGMLDAYFAHSMLVAHFAGRFRQIFAVGRDHTLFVESERYVTGTKYSDTGRLAANRYRYPYFASSPLIAWEIRLNSAGNALNRINVRVRVRNVRVCAGAEYQQTGGQCGERKRAGY